MYSHRKGEVSTMSWFKEGTRAIEIKTKICIPCFHSWGIWVFRSLELRIINDKKWA